MVAVQAARVSPRPTSAGLGLRHHVVAFDVQQAEVGAQSLPQARDQLVGDIGRRRPLRAHQRRRCSPVRQHGSRASSLQYDTIAGRLTRQPLPPVRRSTSVPRVRRRVRRGRRRPMRRSLSQRELLPRPGSPARPASRRRSRPSIRRPTRPPDRAAPARLPAPGVPPPDAEPPHRRTSARPPALQLSACSSSNADSAATLASIVHGAAHETCRGPANPVRRTGFRVAVRRRNVASAVRARSGRESPGSAPGPTGRNGERERPPLTRRLAVLRGGTRFGSIIAGHDVTGGCHLAAPSFLASTRFRLPPSVDRPSVSHCPIAAARCRTESGVAGLQVQYSGRCRRG